MGEISCVPVSTCRGPLWGGVLTGICRHESFFTLSGVGI